MTKSWVTRILRSSHRQVIRGLHALQNQPPAPPALRNVHVESTQLLVDRAELFQRLPANGVIMECGVDEGRLSQQILDIAKPQELILVDTWSTNRFNESKLLEIQRKFSGELAAGNVRIERKTSVEALRKVSDGSLDWIYIDTDHSYKTTLDELLLAARKVSAEGYVCGHDYTLGFWKGYHRYGVIEAVNRFCVEQNWRFAYLTHEPDRHASFALRRL